MGTGVEMTDEARSPWAMAIEFSVRAAGNEIAAARLGGHAGLKKIAVRWRDKANEAIGLGLRVGERPSPGGSPAALFTDGEGIGEGGSE